MIKNKHYNTVNEIKKFKDDSSIHGPPVLQCIALQSRLLSHSTSVASPPSSAIADWIRGTCRTSHPRRVVCHCTSVFLRSVHSRRMHNLGKCIGAQTRWYGTVFWFSRSYRFVGVCARYDARMSRRGIRRNTHGLHWKVARLYITIRWMCSRRRSIWRVEFIEPLRWLRLSFVRIFPKFEFVALWDVPLSQWWGGVVQFTLVFVCYCKLFHFWNSFLSCCFFCLFDNFLSSIRLLDSRLIR